MCSSIRRVVWFVAGVLVCCGGALAQGTRPSIHVPYIDPAENVFVIDGQDDDWPAEALAHGVNFYPGDGHGGTSSAYGTTVVQTMSGRNDGEVTVWLAHDGAWLYVLARIQDNILDQRPAQNNSNPGWQEDALHIYIDSTNAARANIPNPPITNQAGYEQFGVSTDYNCYTENCDFTTNNTSGAAGAGAQPDQVDWQVSVAIAGSGPYTYTFEERIPLEEAPGHNLRTMTPGHSYGFDAEFVDSESGAYPQGWVFWSGDGVLDAWNYQNLWGLMYLEPIPSDEFYYTPLAAWPVALATAAAGAALLRRRRRSARREA